MCLICRAAKRAEAARVKQGNLVLKQVDMLSPDNALGDATWDCALDSALLHCFDPEQQRQYLANLAPHVRTSGLAKYQEHLAWKYSVPA